MRTIGTIFRVILACAAMAFISMSGIVWAEMYRDGADVRIQTESQLPEVLPAAEPVTLEMIFR
jgi:hypothetical protein